MPLDVFDKLDLSAEDKFAVSDEFKKALSEELEKQIKKIPIGKMISEILERELLKRDKKDEIRDKKGESLVELTAKNIQKSFDETQRLEKSISKIAGDVKAELNGALAKLKDEEEKFMNGVREKYDDIRNGLLSQPRYEFGGFSPQSNDLNIGDPSIEGAWRVVKSGNNLSFQRFESGTWVEKGAMTP